MPAPEDRPAAVSARVSRPAALKIGTPRLPVLVFGGLAILLGAAIWLASEQTRPGPALPPPVEVAAQPAPPPVPTIETPPEEAAVAMATRLAPEGTEGDFGVAVPDRYEVAIRIERNDTMARILEDLGIDPADRARAEAAFRAAQKNPRLPEGETITALLTTPADTTLPPVLLQLVLRPSVEREVWLRRRDDGNYEAQAKIYQIVPRFARASGTFTGSLRNSTEAAGVPPQVVAELARAFSYDIDFQRDIRNGDRFSLVVEQAVTTDGRMVNTGRLQWAEIVTKRGPVSVYRFRPERGADQFYTARGETVARSFLRTPMDLSRVSSRFGMREHPILGFTAMHTGVDFAASYGTPVLAAGAGTVEMASPYAGYGNYVRVRHSGNIATAYAHLARFAPGIRPGAHVRQGQVVGFVGSTGMSTGPHLHYEFHVRGKPVNPLTQRVALRNPLTGKDLQRFNARMAELGKARGAAAQLSPPATPALPLTVAEKDPTPAAPAQAAATPAAQPTPSKPASATRPAQRGATPLTPAVRP